MIPHFKGNLPYVDVGQMREIDKQMVAGYGISLMQMMENAGANLAGMARDKFLGNNIQGSKVLVVAGHGGNGGGALVAARRLATWGADVSVLLSSPKGKLKKETAYQFTILQKMSVKVVKEVSTHDLIIDGILGYGYTGGALNDLHIKLINQVNTSGIPVLSLDAPSGINLDNGQPAEVAVKATATLTIGLPKLGLFKTKAAKHVGELFLADISIPPELYSKLGIEVNGLAKAFTEGTVVKINKMVVLS